MARTNSKSKKKPAAGPGTGKKYFPPSGRPASKGTKQQRHVKHSRPGSSKTANAKGSLYGPLSGQQPKGTKWNLTESMGGDGSASSRQSMKRKRPAPKKQSPTNNRKPSSFSLHMPIVSQSDPVVPWLHPTHLQGKTAATTTTTRTTSEQNSTDKNAKRTMHSTLLIPHYSLKKLSLELRAFADYVRLSEAEIKSRQSVIQKIQSLCRTLFGVPSEACQVFGSFSTLSVCTFSSDIDLALHDVVPVAIEQKDVAESDGDVDDDATPRQASKRLKTENSSRIQDRVEPDPNVKRQARVSEWKAALEEAEQTLTSKQATIPIEMQTVTTEEKSSSVEARAALTSSTTVSTFTRVELAESRALPSSAESNDEGLPLFVIDREGCPDADDDDEVQVVRTDAPTVTDTSKDSSVVDGDDNEEDMSARIAAGETRKIEQKREPAKRLNESEEEDEVKDDDSDADSADILAPLKKRLANDVSQDNIPDSSLGGPSRDDPGEEEEVELDTRPRSRSIISLCSATTTSSADEREWDESGMEVSFISSAKSSQKQGPIGPSGEARYQVIRALNSLSKKLRRTDFASGQITVRKFAKVPIINMETRFGYECDIAIGGHNGTDTSSYASVQCSRSESFSIVVLFLKVLLYQHGLDKPFTGGLGSFKLYVLVASHIHNYMELGGADDPAEILLTFFFRYGNIPDASRKGMDERLRTMLTQNSMVQTRGNGIDAGVADLGGVYQLDNCIRVFQICYFILRRKLQKCSTDPSHSVLGHVVDAKSLAKERQQIKSRVPTSPGQKNASNGLPSIPPGFSSSRPRNVSAQQEVATSGAKRKANSIEEVRRRERDNQPLGTDDEAEELKAGYNPTSSAVNGTKAKVASRKRTNSAKKKGKKRKKSQMPAASTKA